MCTIFSRLPCNIYSAYLIFIQACLLLHYFKSKMFKYPKIIRLNLKYDKNIANTSLVGICILHCNQMPSICTSLTLLLLQYRKYNSSLNCFSMFRIVPQLFLYSLLIFCFSCPQCPNLQGSPRRHAHKDLGCARRDSLPEWRLHHQARREG